MSYVLLAIAIWLTCGRIGYMITRSAWLKAADWTTSEAWFFGFLCTCFGPVSIFPGGLLWLASLERRPARVLRKRKGGVR